MSVTQLPHSAEADRAVDELPARADVEIVVPVYNEADQLEASITALHSFLHSSFPLVTTITIADNASTDDTWQIATGLADALEGVDALHLDEKGRGRALRTAWSNSTATVVAYMDVDLATGLDALLPLVAPLLSGHSDLAIGTRLAPGSHVVRGARREFISRGYNLLLRSTLRTNCSDAQCGFKAVRREVVVELLPLVEDDEWFFDTEVLVTAQRLGLRIHEVPVDWVDDTDSRVQVVHTAVQDLRGVWRMLGPESRRRAVVRPARPVPITESEGMPPGLALVSEQAADPVADSLSPGPVAGDPSDPAVSADELLRFAGVGAASTAAYAALFAVLEPALGSYGANTVAIGLCSLANTAAHRGMAGTDRYDHDRTHRMSVAAGLLGVSLATTTVALAAVRSLGLDSRTAQLAAVTSANTVAAVIRFAVLRTWVFRPHYGSRLSAAAALSTASALSTTSLRRARTPQ
jgi:putative flippase GtrA